MSDLLAESLKTRLDKLECHFTWTADMEVDDFNNIEEWLYDQISFLPSVPKYRLYNSLAYTKYLKGEPQEAIRQLQEAEEHLQGTQSADLDIKLAVTYSNYAWLYYHTNQFSKAQSYLEKVEAIYKKFESSPEHDILFIEIYGERAWVLLTFYGKNCERAKQWFEKALVLDPDNPELNSGYAIVMYLLEREGHRLFKTSKSKSIELLQRAVTLNENDTVLKVYLALEYAYIDQAKKGEKIMEEALRQTPESPYLLRHAAKFYRREGNIDKAITILEKSLNQTPNSSSLHYQIGQCYKRKVDKLKKDAKSFYQPTNTRDLREAISSAVIHFEKTIELEEIFVNAYTDLAAMYAKGKHFEKAEDILKKALNLRNLTLEDKQEIHLGFALFKQHAVGSESEAIRHYKEVLLIPNETRFRSYARNNLKHLAEQKVRKYSPEATGFELLGFICQQDGEVTQAIDYYEKALELDPDNQDYLSALFIMSTD